jgi:rSAM/selenodomain-associated transferase 1
MRLAAIRPASRRLIAMVDAATELTAVGASIAVAVFARAPIPGETKTRLIAHLGAQGAARLQSALIRHALKTAIDAATGPVSLWCAPDCGHPAFAALRDEFGIELLPQRGPDLGARMSNAFVDVCRRHGALLIGTDCPALTVDQLRCAAAALTEGHDAVFIPAEDGGYVLVGLARPIPSLFHGVAWGTDRVMRETRERLEAAGVRWRELAASWDVDRPEDVARLRASGLMPEALPPI